jgi:diguanylate cyclase (GGDEF)-like protein
MTQISASIQFGLDHLSVGATQSIGSWGPAALAGLAAGIGGTFVAFSAMKKSTSESTSAVTPTEVANSSQTHEVLALRADSDRLQADLNSALDERDAARSALAEYLEAHPQAGSFDRKFDDATAPFSGLDSTLADPTDPQLLADPETSLFSEAYFKVALDARIASARRHLRPVAVALLEVTEGNGGPGSPEADASRVTASIRQTLRDADTACRMADGSFALILEDTPENGAVWTVERIRRNLTSRHGQHTMWAGVACYPAHAFSTDEILDQATAALESAREWKQDRIEVATAE